MTLAEVSQLFNFAELRCPWGIVSQAATTQLWHTIKKLCECLCLTSIQGWCTVQYDDEVSLKTLVSLRHLVLAQHQTSRDVEADSTEVTLHKRVTGGKDHWKYESSVSWCKAYGNYYLNCHFQLEDSKTTAQACIFTLKKFLFMD